MLTGWHELLAWFELVLSGMAEPWVIAIALALTTLLLEDLAIAAGVALAAQGTISWGLSLAAVGGGIAAGDIGLYALGLAGTRLRWLQRPGLQERSAWAQARLLRNLPMAVLLARVIPGLRLVTYTASGFLRVPLLRFCAWVVLAVTLWTVGLYAISAAIGQAVSTHLGVPPAIAVAMPIVVLAAAFPLWRWLRPRSLTSALPVSSRTTP